ncbi:stage V sporulation protein AB [Ornithinibacillus halotolerans]|uniref:Stage V sporulation protein AB n=1 Tax=Ornithinibacillus halotolerans TaxID=1274357 RepID=A0A916RL99_9BACI|nr:stage V sporulation protein AB [Ornithinibacillus halotolerans]GGA60882.1 stage V sporulation protein AB [Ornithinibacillus halotolerans]
MIPSILINVIEIFIGFAGGLAVGCGFVAFLTVLGIIPRLIQLTKTLHLIKVYTGCVILGTMMGSYLSFANVSWNHPVILLVLWGAFHGIFNGMLAAALTEVLNVFPLLSKRIRLDNKLITLMMAVVLGKIVGSLFQWIILVR